MDMPKPTAQHELLKNMIGEWAVTSSCDMGSGKERQTFKGKETVRALGDVWVVCEGEGDMPGGGCSKTQMTLGYDVVKQKFVGSFLGAMMTNIWVYEGTADASGKSIALDTIGPDFADPTVLKPYRDTVEIVSRDKRVMTSHMTGPDGKWHEIMRAEYTRVK